MSVTFTVCLPTLLSFGWPYISVAVLQILVKHDDDDDDDDDFILYGEGFQRRCSLRIESYSSPNKMIEKIKYMFNKLKIVEEPSACIYPY